MAAIVLAWGVLFNQLRIAWEGNTLYRYGWFVPLLAAYLFYERWLDRPVARVPQKPLWTTLAFAFVAVSFLVYMPLRVVHEANADWTLSPWAIGGWCFVLSLLWLALAGGVPWVRHFWFPFLYALTAIPWPTGVEQALLQSLMRVNAVVVAEMLTLLGHPAIAMGNVIDLGREVVSVDEACSGIQSLQTCFMMSFFLGEFYRAAWGVRLALVGASLAIAALVNLGRTFTLSWIGATRGVDDLAGWHDPLGYVALFLCLALLWVLAWLVAGRGAPPPVDAEAARQPRGAVPPAPRLALLLLGGLLLGEALTTAYYRSAEAYATAQPTFTVNLPRENPTFREFPIPEAAHRILKHSEGTSATWREAGNIWTMYYLRWDPGRVSQYLSRAHSPEICMPAAGMQLVRQLDDRIITVNGLDMPFEVYLFEAGNRFLYVFYVIWNDGGVQTRNEIRMNEATGLDRSLRLEAARAGIRNAGQRILALGVAGPVTASEAAYHVRERLSQMINVAYPEVLR